MLKVIKNLLKQVINDIDGGNSNLSEEECLEVIDYLRKYTDKTQRLSKYSACKYLNMSRATFDKNVKEGKIPEGKHEVGFKEKYWIRKDLDEFMNKQGN